ncbi:hypothetical protein [Planomonospora sp. ID82291]|uniref:hypothetical protein n=1 Tax=Planomonospora sp. ID82291 TaxID=2738136 RepID=UPI0018C42902|nr:hypothetical protein [Planomonospora sp. ID82291]MBG0819040.1 hypothetical protein [Planomonospora sp. ID82291]
MTDTGSRIITALEATWKAVQERHPEIPDVVMITGPSAQRGGDMWGYHWPDRWKFADGSGRAPELFIAGELFGHGGQRTLATLLHEAAHALGTVRGIKNTSRDGNRYHNGKFAELARELGLTPPDKPSKAHGYAHCELGDATAAAYAETITALDAAAVAYLVDRAEVVVSETGEDGAEDGTAGTGEDEGGAKKKRRAGQRHAVECMCSPPRRIQLTPKAMETGPVICGLCGEPFEVPDPIEDQGDDGQE